ncbi:MAG: epoxyqueuosine reductase QueH [Clostridiales bacterium]|nr:epoxyqueuosine reductase QueH [Clostridiales bacterium]
MNAVNYNAEMRKITESLNGEKKKLLLHACCAPCSSACLERLKDFFDVTVFFYNPNIENGEYAKRKAELIRLIAETGWANISDCGHDTSAFYAAVRGYENCKEGGERCEKCFKLRLSETAKAAAAGGFDYFCTTLTLSPLKDAKLINSIGAELAKEHGVSWLFSDFKKENGYLRSLQLSKEHSLYRQNYCGCVFSQKPLD